MGTRVALIALLCLLLGLVVVTLYRDTSEFDRVISRGELVVATRNTPSTYFEGPDGPMGFEYDLAKAFADELGVKLRIVVPENFEDIFKLLEQHDIDLAAAGLTITESRKRQFLFGPPIDEVREQVIYREGQKQPKNVKDLVGHSLEVVAGSSHAERLGEIHHQYPDLTWTEQPEMDSEELLLLIKEGVVDFTIADSNEVSLVRRYTPELRVGFNFSGPKQLAWAFPKLKDESLYFAARDFLIRAKENGLLKQIRERYYGTARRLNYVGTQIYMGHINKRLPKYREYFEAAGQLLNIDWRLIAAMAYQESQWNPRAKSPTGVRGLMMLTLNTAKHMKVENRLDPKESIFGGAKYYVHLKERLPESILEPDRTWMTMAAYNIGLGHLEDARQITLKQGDDPDKWIDVMKHLPLLMRKKWYKQTRYGYARGVEAANYVQNIRSYYDILIWMTEKEKTHKEAGPPPAFGILPPSL
jgi:membrane-bound lytic murein transglycosylase F